MRVVYARAFIREEKKQIIVNDGSTNAATELAKILIVPLRAAERTAVFVERVESSVVQFEQSAAMKLVRAVFRVNLRNRSGVAAIRGVVVARCHHNFLHRLLVGS